MLNRQYFTCKWPVDPNTHLLALDIVHEHSTGFQRCVALFTVPVPKHTDTDVWLVAIIVPISMGMHPTITAHVRSSHPYFVSDHLAKHVASHKRVVRVVDGPCIVWMNHSFKGSLPQDFAFLGLPLTDEMPPETDEATSTKPLAYPSVTSKVLSVPSSCKNPACKVCLHAAERLTTMELPGVLWGGRIGESDVQFGRYQGSEAGQWNNHHIIRARKRAHGAPQKHSVLILQRTITTKQTPCYDYPMVDLRGTYSASGPLGTQSTADRSGEHHPLALEYAQLYGMGVAALLPEGTHCAALHVSQRAPMALFGCVHDRSRGKCVVYASGVDSFCRNAVLLD